MIGTLICRNCETVFEVSEGDVTKFRVHPVFACTVCQSDLSPLMAGFVEGHSAAGSVSNEFSIPDDADVFDGLPMGETFDQAAARMRDASKPATPPPAQARAADNLGDTLRSAHLDAPLGAPSELILEPEATPVVVHEDPLQMALRLAAQATQQAEAMAAQSSRAAEPAPTTAPDPAAEPGPAPAPVSMSPSAATGRAPALAPEFAPTIPPTPASATAAPALPDYDEGVTGIAIRWKPGASAALSSAVPSNELFSSTDAGVVPEAPDNETTARRNNPEETPLETTEPTIPSPLPMPRGRPAAREEPAPVFVTPHIEAGAPETAEEETIPDVADDVPAPRLARSPQPTPTIRSVPAQYTVAPVEEPTIRKTSPPPLPIAPSQPPPPAARTGNGPGSIGALGIRVVSGRPIVHPGGNGRAGTVGVPEVSLSGSHVVPRFEPPRAPPTARATAPAAETDDAPEVRAEARPLPVTLYTIIGATALGLVVVAGWVLFGRHGKPGGAPLPESTPVAIQTSEAAATIAAVPSIAPATPAATTRRTAATPLPTPAPIRTAVAIAPTSPPVRTPATPAPTPRTVATNPVAAESRQSVEEARSKASAGDYKAAATIMYAARAKDSSNELLSFMLWSYAAQGNGPEAMKWAGDYLEGFHGRFTPSAAHSTQVKQWIAIKKQGSP